MGYTSGASEYWTLLPYIYIYICDRLGKRPEDPFVPQTQIGRFRGGMTHNFSGLSLQDFLEWEGHLEIAGLKVFPTTWGGSFWHHDLNDPKASRVMVAYDYEVQKNKKSVSSKNLFR